MLRKITPVAALAILVLLFALLSSSVLASADPTSYTKTADSPDTTQAEGEDIHVENQLELSFSTPSDWHVYRVDGEGRHKGFDPLLVVSHPVTPDLISREPFLPMSESALVISFEGNDLSIDEPLAKYASEKLASIFYNGPHNSDSKTGGNKIEYTP